MNQKIKLELSRKEVELLRKLVGKKMMKHETKVLGQVPASTKQIKKQTELYDLAVALKNSYDDQVETKEAESAITKDKNEIDREITLRKLATGMAHKLQEFCTLSINKTTAVIYNYLEKSTTANPIQPNYSFSEEQAERIITEAFESIEFCNYAEIDFNTIAGSENEARIVASINEDELKKELTVHIKDAILAEYIEMQHNFKYPQN